MADAVEPLEFGVNLNNREPLIAPDYDLQALLDFLSAVEALGFDSVWVGDSLFSKPRYEAMTLLAAISQRTQKVRLGTACLVSSTRNPLYLALEWATLDAISGGRMILGPCMGNPEEGVGASSRRSDCRSPTAPRCSRRASRCSTTCSRPARTSFKGKYYNYDDVAFHSRHRDGAAAPAPELAADLDRLEPAAGR